MSTVRRSARLAAKTNPESNPVAINSDCMLSNAKVDGCCYQQDLRPKLKSYSAHMRDPIENLPIVVKDTEYIDGRGDSTRHKVCYETYCPSCQDYWHHRIKGVRKSVALYCETIVNVGGLPMYNSKVRFEPIGPGESVDDAIRRIYTVYPGAKLMADSAKSDASEWNRV